MNPTPGTLGRNVDAVAFGLLCAPVGIVLGIYISWGAAVDAVFRFFAVYAGFAAFLTSAFFWWLLIQRRNQRTWKRAAMTGFLSGMLAHWLCWYLMLLWANIDFWLLDGPGSSLGEAPVDPLSGLFGVFVYCLWSWAYFSWITVTAGVAIALTWARRSKPLRISDFS